MSLLGTHVLLICHDFTEAEDREFNEWYIREHMPERVALPGFNRGRRFRSVGEGPKYLAFYEVSGSSALSSDDYLKLVRNFDPRSRQFVPRFTSAVRTVSVVRASKSVGEGGIIGLIGFEADAQFAASLGAQLTSTLPQNYGILGAHLLEADDAALAHSRTGHLRQNDVTLPWTLLIEAIDETALAGVWKELSSPAGLASFGAKNVLVRGRYQMLFSLNAQSNLKPLE